MPLVQGRLGYLFIDGQRFPVTVTSVRDPRNLVIPPLIGHTWNTEYAEGLRTAMISVQFAPRRVANAELFAQTFWNRWHLRTFSGGIDDIPTATIVLTAGNRTLTFANAKAGSYRLTLRKSSQVGFEAEFMAAGAVTTGQQILDDYDHFCGSRPLMDYDCSVTGLANGVNFYGLELAYSNNLIMDAPINNSSRALAFDPSVMTATLRLVVSGARLGESTNPLAVEDGPFSLAMSNGSQNTVISMTRCVDMIPHDIDVNQGQIFQTRDYQVLGSCSIPPVVVTVS